MTDTLPGGTKRASLDTDPTPQEPSTSAASSSPSTPDGAASEGSFLQGEEFASLSKFKTPEELAKSYLELQSKLGGKQEPAPTGTESKFEPLTEAVLSEYSKEYAENGKLSDDAYRRLQEAHGLDRGVVDTYIYGQVAQGEARAVAILQSAGFESKEEFTQVAEWAASGALSEGELAAFNAAQVADVESAKLAMQGLKARYDKAFPKAPGLVKEAASHTSGPQPFVSNAEVAEAMSNPLYKEHGGRGDAYRSQIRARLAVSKVF